MTPPPPTPADATIKVRVAGSEDFFEVELADIGESYNSMVQCFAEELDVEQVIIQTYMTSTINQLTRLVNLGMQLFNLNCKKQTMYNPLL